MGVAVDVGVDVVPTDTDTEGASVTKLVAAVVDGVVLLTEVGVPAGVGVAVDVAVCLALAVPCPTTGRGCEVEGRTGAAAGPAPGAGVPDCAWLDAWFAAVPAALGLAGLGAAGAELEARGVRVSPRLLPVASSPTRTPAFAVVVAEVGSQACSVAAPVESLPGSASDEAVLAPSWDRPPGQ